MVLRRELSSAVVIAVVLGCGCLSLYRAINPADLNSVVLINASGAPIDGPIHLDLSSPEKGIYYSRELAGLVEKGITTAAIRAPFFERMILTCAAGRVWDIDLSPRGRYCGAAVIVLKKNGRSTVGWNRMPETDD